MNQYHHHLARKTDAARIGSLLKAPGREMQRRCVTGCYCCAVVWPAAPALLRCKITLGDQQPGCTEAESGFCSSRQTNLKPANNAIYTPRPVNQARHR